MTQGIVCGQGVPLSVGQAGGTEGGVNQARNTHPLSIRVAKCALSMLTVCSALYMGGDLIYFTVISNGVSSVCVNEADGPHCKAYCEQTINQEQCRSVLHHALGASIVGILSVIGKCAVEPVHAGLKRAWVWIRS